jgi:hypothetical protein
LDGKIKNCNLPRVKLRRTCTGVEMNWKGVLCNCPVWKYEQKEIGMKKREERGRGS